MAKDLCPKFIFVGSYGAKISKFYYPSKYSLVALFLVDAFVSFQEVVGGYAELFVPFFTEASGKRLFKKLICSYSFGSSKDFRTFAYFPAVQVHCRKSVILLKPYGVERARYGFKEMGTSFTACLLECAQTFTSGRVCREYAVASVYD